MPFPAKRKSNMQMDFSSTVPTAIHMWMSRKALSLLMLASSQSQILVHFHTQKLQIIWNQISTLQATLYDFISSRSSNFIVCVVISIPPLNSSTLSFWENLLVLKKHHGIPWASPNCMSTFSSASRLISVAGTQAFFSQRQSPRLFSIFQMNGWDWQGILLTIDILGYGGSWKR